MERARGDKRPRRAPLAVLTALVWLLALANSAYRFKLSAKAQITVSLTAKPEAVRVMIDGDRQFDGNYVTTPVKILVPPGRHKIKILRDGYVAHVVSVEGDSGEQFKMDDVVLQRNPDLIFVRVIVIADGLVEGAPYAEIDDGLARGDLPLETAEVTGFSEHVLAVYPKGKGSEAKLRCKFTPQGDQAPEYQIRIKIKGDQAKAVSGCEKTSKKK